MPDRPLRLLDVNVMWPPDFQPFIAGRLRALAAAGVDVTVVTSYHETIDSGRLPFARIIRLPSARESSLGVALRTIQYTVIALTRPILVGRLYRIARRQTSGFKALLRWWAGTVPLLSARPDIVHFEWNSLAASMEWLPELLGAPFVVSCRGRQVNILPYLPGNEFRKDELARTFAKAALVHGVCHDILREAEALGMPADKGRVVYTAVDTEYFYPNRARDLTTDGPIRLLNVGVSMWRKGYEYLLSALRVALDQGADVELEIVDYDGPERDRLEFTISDLELEGRVRILGKLSPEGVREALWRSDIFVLSALSEGVSNAVIEAMACGVPVITTDCGGMEEAVTHGQEGLVVPTRDASAMGDAIARLARDSGIREQMGRAGRARVERDFAPARQAEQFLSLYREILRPERIGRPRPVSIEGDEISAIRSNGADRSPGRRAGGVPLKILTVAALDWRNGHEYGLQAIRELIRRGENVRFTIVGDGPFLEAVGFACRELELSDYVTLRLETAPSEEALGDYDVFLLASVADGAVNGVKDALRAGLPCVCTDTPELRSLAGNGCRMVSRRDPSALADAILQSSVRSPVGALRP